MKRLIYLFLILAFAGSCSQEKCALCMVSGKPEIYIQPVCGDDEFITGHINWLERKHSPDKIKCVIE